MLFERMNMRRIKLTQGQYALVDDWNYEWLNHWGWCAYWEKNTKSFYAIRCNWNFETKKGETFYMAREILKLSKGDGLQSHHKNHDTLNNTERNLEVVTNQINQWNQKNPKGCFYHKRNKKWQAQIKKNGKTKHLGCFDTESEAHQAYLNAKEKRNAKLFV